MSKYHPIDVRHPANRQYRNPNYLLDPPAPDAGSPSPAAAPRSAANFARRQTRPTGPAPSPAPSPAPAAPAAPWGGSPAASSTDTFAPARPSGFLRFLRIFIVLGVIGWVLSRETGLFDTLLLQLRLWAHELGLPLPF